MTVDMHELRVFSGTTALSPVDDAGAITADRGWSPHVQGRLTVAAPDDVDLTAPGSQITIELTQRFGDFAFTRDLTDLHSGGTVATLTTAYTGGTAATLTALITAGSWNTPVRASTGRTLTLVIVSRTRTRDEHALILASHEALIQDWVWYQVDGSLEGVPLTFEADTPGTYLRALLAAHAARVTAGIVTLPSVIDEATPTLISPLTHTITAGAPTIASLDPFLVTTRQRLYSQGDGVIALVDYPFDPGGEIAVEVGINLIDWEVNDERTKNTIVRFTGTRTNPAARPIYHSSAFPELTEPAEVFIDSPSTPVLMTGLMDLVTAEVSPFMAQVGLDESPVRLVTVNDYSVMPGSAVTYTLPDETEKADTIDAITWQLGGRHEMDIWV